ncbi:MAG: hypothetical protein K6F57_00850 [Candidatus Saccharibacteria bacterium]|nr:hypothetical protein [Candidatus Saccharibacteria bacterium]
MGKNLNDTKIIDLRFLKASASISNNARGRVYEQARVFGEASVSAKPQTKAASEIVGNGRVYEHAQVFGKGSVSDEPQTELQELLFRD